MTASTYSALLFAAGYMIGGLTGAAIATLVMRRYFARLLDAAYVPRGRAPTV